MRADHRKCFLSNAASAGCTSSAIAASLLPAAGAVRLSVALFGASGSGKTTLMNILAARTGRVRASTRLREPADAGPAHVSQRFGRAPTQQTAFGAIGETLKRELFDRESPVGKEIRINNVSFRILGVLSRKGANMMGQDQDDIVLAPWTTIKFRVAGTTLSSGNQSGSASASSTSSASDQVNTLSNLYPASTTSLYSTPSGMEAADTPQPIRFTNVDQILAKATSENETEQAIGQITELLRERHRIRPGETEDFNIRDMTELTRTLASASQRNKWLVNNSQKHLSHATQPARFTAVGIHTR